MRDEHHFLDLQILKIGRFNFPLPIVLISFNIQELTNPTFTNLFLGAEFTFGVQEGNKQKGTSGSRDSALYHTGSTSWG